MSNYILVNINIPSSEIDQYKCHGFADKIINN